MPESVYLKILNQLAEIEYSQEVTYSRYNEPLSQRDLILKRISQARQMLPFAKLRTNTNGDYLDPEFLRQLSAAGLNELFIQQYLGNSDRYDHEEMGWAMRKTMDRIEVSSSKYISDVYGHRIEFELHFFPKLPMRVHLRARNFSLEGSGRTEAVADEGYIRTAPCVQPFQNMYIDYNGLVMVCCNTRSDVSSNAHAIMGSVHDKPLWDIYAGEAYSTWRAQLRDESPKTGICQSCKIDVDWKVFT